MMSIGIWVKMWSTVLIILQNNEENILITRKTANSFNLQRSQPDESRIDDM